MYNANGTHTDIRRITVYGAAGANSMFWTHTKRRHTNQTCGAMFGTVFEQYDHVSLRITSVLADNDGLAEHRLTETDNLWRVLTMLDMQAERDVVIWAKNDRAD